MEKKCYQKPKRSVFLITVNALMVCILRNSNGDESGEKGGVGGDCGQVEDRAAYIKYLFFQMFFYVTKMGLHGSTFFTIAISVERYLGKENPHAIDHRNFIQLCVLNM